MKSQRTLLLLAIALVLGLWSCKETPVNPSTGPVSIQGIVQDVATSAPLQNAVVYLALQGTTDSAFTKSDGRFSFAVDLSQLQGNSATMTVLKTGYMPVSYNFNVVSDTSFNVIMGVDRSTSALVVGVLRDSATLYPLRNGVILLSLPGVVDSVTTPVDGTFRLYADLVDRDSLPVTLTAFKTGYKVKHLNFTIHKDQTTTLGDVLMDVDVASTAGQVLGRVFDAQSRLPLGAASVILTSNIFVDSVQTSFAGNYSFTIDLQGLPTISGNLSISKNGYKAQSASFSVDAGQTFSADFYLNRDTTTGVRDTNGTGLAHSIALISVSNNEISVYGVGGIESSILTWEVRDSLGFPIDIDHSDTVTFELMGTPVRGGAYVSPASAMTNASGRVATTVNSGTVSGVLQFVAKLHRESDGVTIESQPVLITVNAGLPDQAHFSIGAEVINFPGYDWLGRIDHMTVQVGDVYSNPVKSGTAVYFSTTGGVIDASGFTDNTSHATVSLYSGHPKPSDAILGPGFAYVHATTMGDGGSTVGDSIRILFSGIAEITNVNPTSFAVARGGSSGPITFSVSDENGNPLASGTHISVTLQYTPPPNNSTINLAVTGDISVTLGDTQARGAGITNFSFQVVDQTQGGVSSQIPVTVVISVTSQNGTPAPRQISGTIG